MAAALKWKVIVAVTLVVLIGICAYGYMEYGYAQDKAEDELADYLAKMYSDRTVLGKQCTGLDTDGDGYISCDARVRSASGVEEKFTVECAATFFNSGCKTKQLLPGIVVPSAR